MTESAKTTVEYKIDSERSLFTVQVFASMTHSPKFAIRDLVGVAMFDPRSLQKASLRVVFPSTKLEIQDVVSREERREIERVMFKEVLQTHSFPKIIFESTAITFSPLGTYLYRVKVAGLLTLIGNTLNHVFEAQVTVGQDALRATGNFALLQSDCGIKPTSAAGGILKIRDELKFGFFILARRKSSNI